MLFIIALDGIITTVAGAVIFSYKTLEFQIRQRMEEIAEKERETNEMRRLAETAKLSALQAQINPHFFFNTLNSVTALFPRDPDRAADTVEKLADLFRYTLKSSEETMVPLAEEIEFVRAYLDIEKLRFGKRLEVEEKIAPDSMDLKVPGLLLQPAAIRQTARPKWSSRSRPKGERLHEAQGPHRG